MSTLRRRALGIAFLAVLALLVGLSVATFQKRFTPVVPVTLEADHVGNQLAPASDVKLRGIIVGEIRSVASTGDGARVRLALDPSRVSMIPANVEARLLPKTLFGERYVALVIPDQRAPRRIRSGDVIGQDRSKAAIELERVLSDLMPLLQTLQPQKVAATLTALADSLRGRGDRLGRNLVDLGDYTRALNTRLPQLENDMRGLADLADTYQAAAPDLLSLLDDLTVTSRTVSEKAQQLDALLRTTTSAADETRGLLSENGDRLIRLAATGRPILALLARYSPEYPCLLTGLARFEPLVEQTFSTRALHITLETVRDRGKYVPGEEPKYVARSGPNCRGLPDPARPYPGPAIPDGSRPRGQGSLDATPGGTRGFGPQGFSGAPDLGAAGGPEERSLLSALVAPALGEAPEQVPDLSSLLFAPLARGMQVRVS
ncbi:MAG TPA: MCE family protein [Mycobacteriales bacterium]|nr:MCE family protein [Mycobacteriales bacterium]